MQRQSIRIVAAVVVMGGTLGGMGIGACASFTEEAPADAGTDAPRVTPDVDGAPDAAVPDGDAGLESTRGIVECPAGDRTCDLTKNERCCYNLDSGTGRCATSCPFGELTVHCDDSTDCLPGSRCCVNPLYGNAECVNTSKCGGDQICRTTEECPQGVTCLPFVCRGRTVGTCGEPGQVMKAFCMP